MAAFSGAAFYGSVRESKWDFSTFRVFCHDFCDQKESITYPERVNLRGGYRIASVVSTSPWDSDVQFIGQRDRTHIFLPVRFFQYVFICLMVCLYFAVSFFFLVKVLLLFFYRKPTTRLWRNGRANTRKNCSQGIIRLGPVWQRWRSAWGRCRFGWPGERFRTGCWQQWRGTRTHCTCCSKKGRALENHRQVWLTISGDEDASLP